MIEEKKQRKNKVIKAVALLGLFLMVFGISYALFRVTLNGNKINKIKTAKFSLKITDKNGNEETEGYGINLENSLAVPMGTIEALDTLEPYEFNLENDGDYPIDYKLYLEVPNTSDLPDNKIKYNLVRNDIKETLSVANAETCDIDADCAEPELDSDNLEDLLLGMSKTLSSTLLSSLTKVNDTNSKLYEIDLGTIGPKQVQSYSLRMWIAYAAGTEIENKTFESRLKVDGVQASSTSAYPLFMLEDDSIKYIIYSDDSLHLSPPILSVNGFTTTLGYPFESEESHKFLFRYYGKRYLSDSSLLASANTILRKYNMDEVNSGEEFGELIIEMMYPEEESNSEEKYTEAFMDEFSVLLDDFPAEFLSVIEGNIYFKNLYIEKFIKIKGDNNNPLFHLISTNNIYIDTTVDEIGGCVFREVNAKNIEFKRLSKVTMFTENSRNLKINSYAFSSSDSLLTVTLPNYINNISDNAFNNCPNLDLKINRQQSSVSVGSNSFRNIKSVTWAD